ncbi:MAG TPA: RNA methyltransferase [Gemmatimonadaceae bacterium]
MKLLTLARDLKRRKARDRQRLFVSEGVRAVEELLRSPLAIRGALTAPQLLEAPRGARLAEALRERGVSVEDVEGKDFGSAAETDSPQGVIAIADIPTRSFSDVPPEWKGTVLVLDGLQDPGNVGTIVRAAAALGAAATVAMPGTVDLWNAKVVRSGMGAHFRHLAFSGTWQDVDAFRSAAHAPVWAADAGGSDVAKATKPSRVVLVVGNEGAGISADAKSRAERTVSVPIANGVESLNVAVATGILLHALGAP